jgi:hypothetical protein
MLNLKSQNMMANLNTVEIYCCIVTLENVGNAENYNGI